MSKLVWVVALGALVAGGAVGCGSDGEDDAGDAGSVEGTDAGDAGHTPVEDFLGAKDIDFAPPGQKTLDVHTHELLRAHLVPDGVLILAADADLHSRRVLRLSLDGTPDEAFNTAAAASLAEAVTGWRDDDDLRVSAVDEAGRLNFAANKTPKLIRLKPDGTLDSSFGDAGVLAATSLQLGVEFDEMKVMSMTFQSDGMLLVSAGIRSSRTHESNWVLFRLDAGGELDTTFNASGVVILGEQPSLASYFDSRKLLVVAKDGAIFATDRRESLAPDPDTIIAKVLANGKLDPTFGQDGLLTISGNVHKVIDDLAFDGEGRLVLVGQAEKLPPRSIHDPARGFITRYLANGTLDSSFGTAGSVRISISHHALQSAGWGVLFGSVWFRGDRILAGGMVRNKTGSSSAPTAFAVVLQFDQDGKLLTPAEDTLGRVIDFGFLMARRELDDFRPTGFVFPTPDGKVLAIGHAPKTPFPKSLVFGRWK